LWHLASSKSFNGITIRFSESAFWIFLWVTVFACIVFEVTFLELFAMAIFLTFILFHATSFGEFTFWCWLSTPVAFVTWWFWCALLVALIIWDASLAWLAS